MIHEVLSEGLFCFMKYYWRISAKAFRFVYRIKYAELVSKRQKTYSPSRILIVVQLALNMNTVSFISAMVVIYAVFVIY